MGCRCFLFSSPIPLVLILAGDHSKYDHILLVKIGNYLGFCVYRRSWYLLWSPVNSSAETVCIQSTETHVRMIRGSAFYDSHGRWVGHLVARAHSSLLTTGNPYDFNSSRDPLFCNIGARPPLPPLPPLHASSPSEEDFMTA